MSSSPPLCAFGPFVLDASRRLLLRGEEEVPLTPKAFDLLRLLVERRGEVVPKERLLEEVWPGTVVEESNLAFQISALRKILREKDDATRYIATVPGRGYQFVAPVELMAEREIVLEERSRTTVELEESDRRVTPWIAAAGIVLALILVAGREFVARAKARTSPAARPQSLAVLPFKPIVSVDSDEALEIGMADALIGRISGIEGVIVRPLQAVRRYSGDEDPIEAGRSLGVEAVLAGTMHRSGDQIRISARLLRVSDSRQLWGDTFDDRFSGIFHVQDSISRRIADALALTLSPEYERRMRNPPTRNMEAYREYASGRLYQGRAHAGDLRTLAIPHFERAIQLDPSYADAWASLASCWATLPIISDERPHDSFVHARSAAEKAVSLDPSSAEAHGALGAIHFWYLWDWARSEAEYRHAIELDPGNLPARSRYAHLLSNIGRHEESRIHAIEAQKLDPLSPLVSTLSAQFLLHAGDVGSGLRLLQRTLQIDPDFWIARLNLGKAYEHQGRYEEALIEYRRALERSGPNAEPLMMIGYVQGRHGDKAEAERILREMVEIARERYVPPTRPALIYLGLGRHDEAFSWLRRACEERDPGLVFLYANPRWRMLEHDRRFEEIQRCVNLPEWR